MTLNRGQLETRLVEALKQEMQSPPDAEVFREVGSRLGIGLLPDMSSLAQGAANQSAASGAVAGIGTAGKAASVAATSSAWFLHPVSIFLASVAVGTTALVGIAPGAAPKSPSVVSVPQTAPTHGEHAAKPLAPPLEPDVSATEGFPEQHATPELGLRGVRSALRGSNAAAPSASTATAASLSAQQALLDAARRALSRGDHAAALEALSWHRAQFAKTALAEERDALTVKALRASGRVQEADKLAARFLRVYPRSVFISGMSGEVLPNP